MVPSNYRHSLHLYIIHKFHEKNDTSVTIAQLPTNRENRCFFFPSPIMELVNECCNTIAFSKFEGSFFHVYYSSLFYSPGRIYSVTTLLILFNIDNQISGWLSYSMMLPLPFLLQWKACS